MNYDVWQFHNAKDRNTKNLDAAQKLGTVGSFKELNDLTTGHVGLFGYTKEGTREWVEYSEMMSSWGEQPWAAKK